MPSTEKAQRRSQNISSLSKISRRHQDSRMLSGGIRTEASTAVAH